METGYDNLQDTHKQESGVKILSRYLRTHGKINPVQAFTELGIYRLGARIFELRHDLGWKIKCETKKVNGKTHSCYVLIEAGQSPFAES